MSTIIDDTTIKKETTKLYEPRRQAMKNKSTLRKELKLKKGCIQISNHGAGRHSIQVFSKGGLVQDINVTAEQLGL